MKQFRVAGSEQTIDQATKETVNSRYELQDEIKLLRRAIVALSNGDPLPQLGLMTIHLWGTLPSITLTLKEETPMQVSLSPKRKGGDLAILPEEYFLDGRFQRI